MQREKLLCDVAMWLSQMLASLRVLRSVPGIQGFFSLVVIYLRLGFLPIRERKEKRKETKRGKKKLECKCTYANRIQSRGCLRACELCFEDSTRSLGVSLLPHTPSRSPHYLLPTLERCLYIHTHTLIFLFSLIHSSRSPLFLPKYVCVSILTQVANTSEYYSKYTIQKLFYRQYLLSLFRYNYTGTVL